MLVSVVGFKKFCVFSPLRGDLVGKIKFPTGYQLNFTRKKTSAMISASLNSPEIGKNRFYLQNKFPIRNLIFQLENLTNANKASTSSTVHGRVV